MEMGCAEASGQEKDIDRVEAYQAAGIHHSSHKTVMKERLEDAPC